VEIRPNPSGQPAPRSTTPDDPQAPIKQIRRQRQQHRLPPGTRDEVLRHNGMVLTQTRRTSHLCPTATARRECVGVVDRRVLGRDRPAGSLWGDCRTAAARTGRAVPQGAANAPDPRLAGEAARRSAPGTRSVRTDRAGLVTPIFPLPLVAAAEFVPDDDVRLRDRRQSCASGRTGECRTEARAATGGLLMDAGPGT
jgi:hypothetical protein